MNVKAYSKKKNGNPSSTNHNGTTNSVRQRLDGVDDDDRNNIDNALLLSSQSSSSASSHWWSKQQQQQQHPIMRRKKRRNRNFSNRIATTRRTRNNNNDSTDRSGLFCYYFYEYIVRYCRRCGRKQQPSKPPRSFAMMMMILFVIILIIRTILFLVVLEKHSLQYSNWISNMTKTLLLQPTSSSSSFSSSHSNRRVRKQRIQRQPQRNRNDRKTRVTIFYNLYIPPKTNGKNDKDIQNAVSIISEQIHQIGASDLFYRQQIHASRKRKQQQRYQRQNQIIYERLLGSNGSIVANDYHNECDDDHDIHREDETITLYYNSIGNDEPIKNGIFESWCYESNPRLKCIQLNHYPLGDESITLQSLYDYCWIQSTTQPSDTNSNNNDNLNLSFTGITERVVYLHSKGTYHSADGKNDAWRRALTAAALHIDCIEPPPTATRKTCNLCGLQFYTLFTFFVPGNMWTADCKYVKQLLPPLLMTYNATTITTNRSDDTSNGPKQLQYTSGNYGDDNKPQHRTSLLKSQQQQRQQQLIVPTIYQRKRDETVTQFLIQRTRGYVDSTLLRDRIDYYGLDRYSSEHWIGSHPYLLPCDVDPIGSLHEIFSRRRSIWFSYDRVLDVHTQRNTKWDNIAIDSEDNDNFNDDDNDSVDEYGFRFHMGPRHTGFVVANVDSAHDALLDDVTIRLREYYLLPGHLLKWSTLYQLDSNGTVSSFVVPPSDSWIWDWFPDGSFWRTGMEQYGIENVVRILNQNYTFHVGVPSDQIHTVASAFSEPIMNGGPNAIESSEHNSIPLKNHYNRHEHETDESNTLVRRNKEKQVVLQHIQPNITLSNESMKEYVVFYHISFRDSDNDEKIIELIEEQIEIIASSYAAIVSSIQNQQLTVFYTIIGQNSIVVQNKAALINDICLQYSNLQCRLLNQFDQDYEGETLNELHRFCTATARSNNDFEDNLSNIDATVIYINNQGPIQLRQEGISLRNVILHTTMAVTDRLCSLHQHMPPSPISSSTSSTSTTCNVCGLIFYTIWTFFYPGNMFAAKCSYVRQLLSPKMHEYQMTNHVIGKILLAKIRMKLTMSLIPKLDRRPDYIALDRYSIDHWIGSHPHVRPCDLSDIDHNYEYWDRTPPQIEPSVNDIRNDVNHGNDNINRVDTLVKSPSYFHLEAGPPRHGNSVPSILLYYDIMKNWTAVRDNVLLDESKRLREYCYLAGHLFKWYELYNMTPPNDSWVWTTDYFPDATIWRDAVEKHGKYSINVITAKYAKDGM